MKRRNLWTAAWLVLATLPAVPALAAAAQAPAALLDDFRQPALWQATASDQVSARLRPAPDGSLCLDYDFAGVSGYAVMRRPLALDWPEQFELRTRLRGGGAVNDLQIKLVDASGDNVWWVNRPNSVLPKTLSTLKLRRRHFDFAWGPSSERSLRSTAFIEFVIAAGRERGKGSLCLAGLSLQPRAADPQPWPEAVLSDHGAERRYDFRHAREFNGLALQWPAGSGALDYQLLASDDGRRWRLLRQVRGSDGGLDALFLPEQEARYLAVRRQAGQGLPELQLRSAAQWPSFNAVLAEQAQALPAGELPRAFRGQQNYWTLVGVDGGGSRSGLISEDGAIEVGRAGFSIEPSVLLEDGRRVGWAQVAQRQSLREGYLPQPAVHWQHAEFSLDVEAAADGPATAPQLLARYRLRNSSARPQNYRLQLALRPWQVNPPQQFLSTPGGASPVHSLAWQWPFLQVNGRPALQLLSAPRRVSAQGLDGGLGLAALAAAPALQARPLRDPQQHASALLDYALQLAPGESVSLGWVAPLGKAAAEPAPAAAPDVRLDARLDARFDASAAHWRERLNRVQLKVPAAAQPVADSLRSALAQILISREAAALQPGTRSYARSWVRDGAMMVAGLLRLGEVAAAREFVDWYGGHVFASGKVPCCVDQRGADPVVENDSHGQYLYALAELWRHTGDRELLRRHWPQVQRVWAWMEALRQSERGPRNETPERRHLYGLMPPSISHEGYSDKPAYSLWDDFWALRGYKDAVQMAAALDEPVLAARWAGVRDEFQRELVAAIAAGARHHGLAFIPGALDRGDFDATSTTVALNPAQAQDALPPGLLEATFERYWQEMSARSEGRRAWRDYTPYELRSVGALLRLGQAERAHAMLDFFFRDQRPAGWNQWAEVVLPDAREPRFLGDMPHAWISSDYIRSALDLFAYEREAGDGSVASLLIGAGLKPEWLRAGTIALSGLSTPVGPLSYRLQPVQAPARGWLLQLQQAGAAVRLQWPLGLALPRALHEGQVLPWQGRELALPPAPATVQLLEP